MGRVIHECEHFVPAIVKFITTNVATDGAVATAEPYLVSAIPLNSYTNLNRVFNKLVSHVLVCL